MAKPTKTSSLRSLITRQIKRMEQRGYNIPESVKRDIKEGGYQRLKSYRDKGYKKLYGASTYEENGQQIKGTRRRLHERVEAGKKGAKTRKAAQEFNRYKERFKDIEGQFDPDTGEIYDEYYKRQEEEQQKEKDYYDRTGRPQGEGTMPQEDTVDTVLGALYDFMATLNREPPDYYIDSRGKRKYMPPWVKEQIKHNLNFLKQLLDQAISEGRATQIAQALELNAEEVQRYSELLFSYYEREQNAAVSYFAKLITNRTLSISELSELEAAQEMTQGYYEP